MRPCISLLIAVAVLFHMTVGCCSHSDVSIRHVAQAGVSPPSHHDDLANAEEAEEAHGHHSACHHKHHSPCQQKGRSPSQQKGHSTCHGDGVGCLAISSTRHVDSWVVSLDVGAWNVPAVEAIQKSLCENAAGFFQSDQTPEPPLRLHLLLQVLLT